MRSNFFILLFYLTSVSCSKPEDISEIEKHKLKANEATLKTETVVSDHDVYYFVNEALKEIELYTNCPNVLEGKNFINLDIENSKLNILSSNLHESDTAFIKNQILASDYFTWNQKYIKNKVIVKLDTSANSKISYDKAWENIRKKYDCIIFMDKPIFNKEKNKAIINIQNSDVIKMLLFIKTDGSWWMEKDLQTVIID